MPKIASIYYSNQMALQYNMARDSLVQKETSSKASNMAESKHGSTEWLQWWFFFLSLSVLAVMTRLYKIDEPSHVCWDETHFGKMGSWYLNQTFFFDVHPPLGKMLVGLSGYLSGYNGSFPFNKPGDEYTGDFYIPMRLFCALLGTCLIPLVFCITWELTFSLTAAVFSSLLVLCDTGVLTLSQYILLDPPLMFFIIASTYCLLKFHSMANQPFSLAWWFWLVATGAMLACAISVKFVGLFVVALAGYTTAMELWNILGNQETSMVQVIKHLIARAGCLIALPISLYMVFFYIHFLVLSKSGGGDGFFSSAFQSQLEGNPLYKASMPENIAYGSVITLKNYRTGGAYLHSHFHLYPEGIGARQQQVTTYSHKDENNRWLIKKYNSEDYRSSVDIVKNGDLVRLEHVATKRNMHSHKEPAPLTRRHYQVTCYGEDGVGDANDIFRIDMPGGREKEKLRTVRSVFRLVHLNMNCAVQSHNKQLPKWGWEQMEVTCNPSLRDKRSLWNIEEVLDERLPNKSFEVFAPSFFEKFLESHAVMAQGNAGLKPKEGEVTSRPWQWPVNYRGQPFSGGDYRVYLLGNPVVWWGNLGILSLFLVFFVVYHICKQRGKTVFDSVISEAEWRRFSNACTWILLAWAVHYFPFWTMGRVLYFHHYFPSFLYSCILSGATVDFLITLLTKLMPEFVQFTFCHSIHGLLVAILVYSFYLFSPLSYGMHGALADEESSVMSGLKWLDSWDI